MFTVLPWAAGAALYGWRGVLAGLAAQWVAMHAWKFWQFVLPKRGVPGGYRRPL